ncbi:hypothetical protein EUTSA_v10001174mg [Eutrema salsugineum]|uniref:Homeobox domain-containing protein n=1 Tax=Eutrema salsugineum TaxID=72664 RepID=V4KQ45_EUTSA|nr:WUSCHEL-related homeobox 6 [Eutrema salsugineum]ESQ39995.1 hypothetical protein EUTSA_v10001174mg [Eutrema salsugineum]
MGYISNKNLINFLPLPTTQPHLLLTQCDITGNDHHQIITGSSSGEIGDDRKNNLPTAATSRWNPTPEQITTLEEVYRSGTRTPTTEQIQKIASKLRKYGRIEGKNVFYWFQNHKARERLKRRRCEGDDDINNVREPHHHVKDSSSGGSRVDHTKSCPSFPHTNPQPQDELAPANCNKANNEEHGTTRDSERASEDGKDTMWRNLVTSSVTQKPREINIDENVNGEVEEETREITTLNLFPVMENQEITDRFTEKKERKANQVYCNFCCYYEFMPHR